MLAQSQDDQRWTPVDASQLPQTLEASVELFLRYGVSFLPLGNTCSVKDLIRPLDQGFEQFLQQAGTDDPRFAVSYEPGGEIDTGLIIRRGEAARDGDYDHKDYFHFRMQLTRHPDFAPYSSWTGNLATVMGRLRQRVSQWLAILDQAVPGYDLHSKICTDQTIEDEVIRQIHYRRTRPGTQIIARRHRGRAGVVLALWENYPGLVGEIGGVWKPFASYPDYPLIFAGQRLVQLTQQRIEAFLHEVVHVEGAEKVQRRAIVAFFDPHNMSVTLPTH